MSATRNITVRLPTDREAAAYLQQALSQVAVPDQVINQHLGVRLWLADFLTTPQKEARDEQTDSRNDPEPGPVRSIKREGR